MHDIQLNSLQASYSLLCLILIHTSLKISFVLMFLSLLLMKILILVLSFLLIVYQTLLILNASSLLLLFELSELLHAPLGNLSCLTHLRILLLSTNKLLGMDFLFLLLPFLLFRKDLHYLHVILFFCQHFNLNNNLLRFLHILSVTLDIPVN